MSVCAFWSKIFTELFHLKGSEWYDNNNVKIVCKWNFKQNSAYVNISLSIDISKKSEPISSLIKKKYKWKPTIFYSLLKHPKHV